jgi:hypothetical protein
MSVTIEKWLDNVQSIFAVPRFTDLRAALQRYAGLFVRHSTCHIMRKAWEADNRLFFRPGPEELLRTSLHQYLMAALVGATTRAEQNVDESHPVDIRVGWDLSIQEAIIEIKWLGKSREAGRIRSEYSAARARDGARQLADYLDKAKQSAPARETRGYLVVIDGRRARLRADTVTLDHPEAFRYQSEEIDYEPRYHMTRPDFEEPFRMFAEPVV